MKTSGTDRIHVAPESLHDRATIANFIPVAERSRRPAGSRFATLALLAAIAILAAATRPVAAQQLEPATGRLTGRVHTAGGAAVAGAELSLPELGRAATAGADGGFTFDSLPAGRFTLLAARRAITVAELHVTIERGRTTRADVVIADTGAATLRPVVVSARVTHRPAAPLPDVRGTEIFSGKRTEVVALDSVTANTAQDVTRTVLARVPGLNISETESSGFPSNGIGFRGLNPVQSVETNVRQDGVNIVADLYGYPETYYAPPAEALQRVELVRGGASLQYGPQFGGMVDYVLRDGTPNTPAKFTAKETAGSFGLFDSYAALSGGSSRATYFAYAQYRREEGWRPNADVSRLAAAARVRWRASDRMHLALEYSMLRNRIHMPGGLDDAQFAADPRSSFRARNWLASPWNILAATMELDLSPTTRLTSTLSGMYSQRYLVWRNEDGGPAAPDVDPATGEPVAREVERESFANLTSETRLLTTYSLLGGEQTLAVGLRLFAGRLHRQEGGPGTTGSGFDMTLLGPYETDARFGDRNVALFAENVFRVGPRLSITPGVRVEYLRSTASGHTDTTFAPRATARAFPLAGLGVQLRTGSAAQLYANITQAYRPIEDSYLVPFASLTRIDPHLRDPKGYTADLGWRGSLGGAIDADLGAFYIAYRDRIGLVSGVDGTGAPYTERRNVANSEHRGIEAYVSVRPLALVGAGAGWGSLELFDALGWTRARYTTGEFAGRTVEYAPAIVNRAGATWALGRVTTTVQVSSVSRQFTDANNTVASENATVGEIPAYTLLDWSAKVRVADAIHVEGGVSNLANARYFTMRTGEYPGPGIIPGIGRSVYLTVAVGAAGR